MSLSKRLRVNRKNRFLENALSFMLAVVIACLFYAISVPERTETEASVGKNLSVAIEASGQAYGLSPALIYGVLVADNFRVSPEQAAKELRRLQEVNGGDLTKAIIAYGGWQTGDNPKAYYYKVVREASKY